MTSETVNTTDGAKLAPHEVRSKLCLDVGEILRVCVHQFDEVKTLDEDLCFDVDAVVEGRGEKPHLRVRQAIVHERIRTLGEQPLTRANAGNFIPRASKASERPVTRLLSLIGI